MTSPDDDPALADLLELVLSGRPERILDPTVERMPPDRRAAFRAAAEGIAALGLAEPPVPPSRGLRDRALASFRGARERRARRALLVCDMLNDHLTPGRPLEVPRARAIVPALARRIDQARSEGVPVVYVCDRHAPDDVDLDGWAAHAIEGSEGAAVWPALAPAPGDRVVTKPSYSGFFASSLDPVLTDLAVDTLVLTGCLTEIHLMATAMDAMQRGFAVEVPRDAQAGASETAEKIALATLGGLVPYGPSRSARLERIAAASAETADGGPGPR